MQRWILFYQKQGHQQQVQVPIPAEKVFKKMDE
jgi:hypothetical protein